MGQAPPGDVRAALAGARRLWTAQQVADAYDRLALEVTGRLAEEYPLVLAVMVGGMIPAAELVRRLVFPLELDYLHATRYQGGTRGGELHWVTHPRSALQDRCVLVVDDILDEGFTLAAIVEQCRGAGARAVHSCVLLDKQHNRARMMARADFTGLLVEDRYVFGCGMDYQGCWRNLGAIYALD